MPDEVWGMMDGPDQNRVGPLTCQLLSGGGFEEFYNTILHELQDQSSQKLEVAASLMAPLGWEKLYLVTGLRTSAEWG